MLKIPGQLIEIGDERGQLIKTAGQQNEISDERVQKIKV